jgi:serine/threonine protein kinase
MTPTQKSLFFNSLEHSCLLYPDQLSKFNSIRTSDSINDTLDTIAYALELESPNSSGAIRQILAIVKGNFEVVAPLGEGAMGSVFKVINHNNNRVEALKIIRRDIVSPKTLSRFTREIKLLAKIDCKTVIRLYDSFFDDPNNIYYTMEYLTGITLEHFIKTNRPASLFESLSFIIDAATGLTHMHTGNVVHRDIKPSNLFLNTASDTVVVLDLGIAHRLQINENAELTSYDTSLTRPLVAMGTIHYMAPEQERDAHLADHRADIYSLGCVMHFILTGKPPYDGTTRAEIRQAHNSGPLASLIRYIPGVPTQLEQLFQQMIARDPLSRPTSARKIIDSLDVIRAGVGYGK